jgi:8-oxo-dGTP diphosphatase
VHINRFNIRVYGILKHNNCILLVHEHAATFEFVKFPGGGLEFGEGLHDGLKREFLEETGLDIEIEHHIYTTDFFQQSAFKPNDQLISVYYAVKAKGDLNIREDSHEIITSGRIEKLRFFWVDLHELNESMLTFPIDKKVCNFIKPSDSLN